MRLWAEALDMRAWHPESVRILGCAVSGRNRLRWTVRGACYGTVERRHHAAARRENQV